MIELRTLPIEQLQPAPYNPRRPLTAKALAKLKASIVEFGLVEPLLWNETTGYVVGGHARLAILRELGFAAIPVSVVRLSPEREKALNIVLNNQEAQGRYDPSKLLRILEELQSLPELSLTGFEKSDLRNLKFDPVAELPSPQESDTIEVMLVIEREKYDSLLPELDRLVQKFDLVTHVRKTAT